MNTKTYRVEQVDDVKELEDRLLRGEHVGKIPLTKEQAARVAFMNRHQKRKFVRDELRKWRRRAKEARGGGVGNEER